MKTFTFILATVCSFSLTGLAAADLVYQINPQTLTNETTNELEYIYGGTLRMLDNAADDGILTAEEILEVTVHNSLAGTIVANDDFDITNVNLTFNGLDLNGSLRVQQTATGQAFVDWGGGDLISISNEALNEYAQADWNAPFSLASRAVPEPGSAGIVFAIVAVIAAPRRNRRRRAGA